MAKRPTLWLTRPREDSTSFAKELSVKGFTCIISPVLHIVRQPMPTLAVPTPDALLITSRHATHALAELPPAWRQLPAYCVGSATAQSATEHKLTRIIPGARNALALLPHIVSDLPAGSNVLYLAGDETRTDVVGLLAAKQIQVTTSIVYRAIAERTINDEIRAALTSNQVNAVAFFSGRSAEIACTLMKQNGFSDMAANINAYCLSDAVAKSAGALRWSSIQVCHTPTRHAMRELIVSREGKKV